MEQEKQSVERLNPLADIVFSCMFQDMQGAPAMKELVNAVLTAVGDEPIAEIIEMRSQYPQLADQPDGKTGRLDIKARTADGEMINTEVQLEAENFFVDRELFYGNKLLSEELKAGESYQKVAKTRIIAFMDFVLRKDHPDIVQPIKLMYSKEPTEVATDKLRIYNVELPKFKKQYDSIEDVSGDTEKGEPLLQWLYLLTQGYQSEEEMQMLGTRTAGMDNFTELYQKANADQKLRDRYEYLLSARLDENSRLESAKDEGIKKGSSEQIRKDAISMYKKGNISPATIALILEVTIADVNEWLGITEA